METMWCMEADTWKEARGSRDVRKLRRVNIDSQDFDVQEHSGDRQYSQEINGVAHMRVLILPRPTYGLSFSWTAAHMHGIRIQRTVLRS